MRFWDWVDAFGLGPRGVEELDDLEWEFSLCF